MIAAPLYTILTPPLARPAWQKRGDLSPAEDIQPQVGVYLDAAGLPQKAYMTAQASGVPGAAVVTSPGTRVLVPLDIATVTTGGTAVTALTAGHRTAGGWISNPISATINLGINEIGTATGTTSSGSTTFIAPGQTYNLQPSGNAVSVISSDSSHPFSGMGYQ